MGLLSGILGDDEQEVTTKSAPWKAQRPYLRDIFSKAEDWYSAGGQQYYPPFSTVAGFDPWQIAGLQGLGNYANSPQLAGLIGGAQGATQSAMNPYANPYLQGAGASLYPSQNALIGAAGRSLNPLSGPGGDAISQMLSGQANMAAWDPAMQAVTRNAVEDFSTQILPQLRSEALGAGQMGSSRHQLATGLAADAFNENLLNTQAQMAQAAASEASGRQYQGLGALQNLYSQGISAAGTGMSGLGSIYSPTMNAMLQGINLAPRTAEFGAYPSSLMQNIGGTYQAQNQAQLSDEAQRYLATQGTPLQNLQNYLGMIQGNYGSTQTQSAYTNPLMNLLGMGAMGASLYGLAGGLGGLGGLSGAGTAATSMPGMMAANGPAALGAPAGWSTMFAGV